MAHFAELDENNIVVYVTVGRDEDDENELTQRTGKTYKKCSYNTVHGVHRLGGTPLRKNYPGIGYIYDEERDAFIPPGPVGINLPKKGEPMPEGSLYSFNEESCAWDITVPKPEGFPDDDENQSWQWYEAEGKWIGIREYQRKVNASPDDTLEKIKRIRESEGL